MGVVVGALITFTNLSLGLQSGWISAMTLQGSLLGFALFKLIPPSIRVGGREFVLMRTPLTPKENVVVQTVASAIGSLPLVSGAIGVLPALGLLDRKQDGMGPLVFTQLGLWLWTTGLALYVGITHQCGHFFREPFAPPDDFAGTAAVSERDSDRAASVAAASQAAA